MIFIPVQKIRKFIFCLENFKRRIFIERILLMENLSEVFGFIKKSKNFKY